MGNKGSVLIVDDHKIAVEHLHDDLIDAGFKEVHFFQNPAIALGELKTLNPSVIISDYTMPHMNGIEFLTKAKQVCPDAVCVILTSEDKSRINGSFDFKTFDKIQDHSELLVAAILEQLDGRPL